jgi:hypothetical protein
MTIVEGSVVTGGKSAIAALREFWISKRSMTTMLAMASTMGTALGTTHGSCRPRAANTPAVPSYCAVCCASAMVAGDLNPTLQCAIDQKRRLQISNYLAPEIDVLSVSDPTLHTTTPIGGCTQRTVCAADKGVVMLASWDLCSAEPRADFESFGGGNGEHGVCEVRFELVKDGLAETCGHVA